MESERTSIWKYSHKVCYTMSQVYVNILYMSIKVPLGKECLNLNTRLHRNWTTPSIHSPNDQHYKQHSLSSVLILSQCNPFPSECISISQFHLFLHDSYILPIKNYVSNSAYVITHACFIYDWLTMLLISHPNCGKKNKLPLDARDIKHVRFPRSHSCSEIPVHNNDTCVE